MVPTARASTCLLADRVASPAGSAGCAQPLGFNATRAPIDVLIPPFFHRGSADLHGNGMVACVTYAGTGPRADSSGGALAPGESATTLVQGTVPHHGDAELGAADSGPYLLGARAEEKQNVKQGLLEELLGVSDGAPGEFGTGRPLPVPSAEEEVNVRLRGTRCDASYITTASLLLRLVAVIVKSRTDPERVMVGCVSSIDLSHTTLGLLADGGLPIGSNDAAGDDDDRLSLLSARMYPDQRAALRECSPAVRARLARRSLCISCVAPLLFVPAPQHYAVTQLVCSHCELTDSDAEALALILQHKTTATHRCVLQSLDLSSNRITNAGAAALLKALTHNHTLTELTLAGNDGITRHTLLEAIEKRLAKNKKSSSKKPSLLRRLFTGRQ